MSSSQEKTIVHLSEVFGAWLSALSTCCDSKDGSRDHPNHFPASGAHFPCSCSVRRSICLACSEAGSLHTVGKACVALCPLSLVQALPAAGREAGLCSLLLQQKCVHPCAGATGNVLAGVESWMLFDICCLKVCNTKPWELDDTRRCAKPTMPS